MATADTAQRGSLGGVLTLRGFERSAEIALGLVWLVVATGAVVRLTASGLGCPHWPTCQAESLSPPTTYHAVIEFGNRVISGIAMLATVATAWIGWKTAGVKRDVRWVAILVAAGTVAQVPLGGITVYYDLNPYLVMSHFLLAMAVVAGGTWVVYRARAQATGRTEPLRVDWLTLVAAVAVLSCLVLVTTGAFSTAAGPHPGSTTTVIKRIGNFYDTVYIHVRAGATYGIVLAILAVWLWLKDHGSVAFKLALATVGLTLVQFGVGEYQYRNGLPWKVIAVHVSLAATLLILTVFLACEIAYRRTPRSGV
jgi:heme a synthase